MKQRKVKIFSLVRLIFSQVEECLDEFFKCDEIDEEFKAIVALSMLKVLDECQELSNAKVVNIFMS